jgi:uncharacterized membrane protein
LTPGVVVREHGPRGQTRLADSLAQAVRSGDQLTLGERAADRMRAVMGSWPFVFCFFAIMII